MKLMKSFPGASLLIPMFLSALIHTVNPDLFKIGGLTQALLTGQSLNYIIAVAIFFSGCGMDLQILKGVFKRYGLLGILKWLLGAFWGFLYMHFFGLAGIGGISAIAFICAITATNPSLFLALMKDNGDSIDESAFGLVALLSVPVVPMLIYSLGNIAHLDFMPIVSTLIPLLLGMLIGNLDKELGRFFTTGMGPLIILLGWAVGAGINLLDALKAGLPGLLMGCIFYLIIVLPMVLFERKILKRTGTSSLGINTMSGLATSIPLLMSASNPELVPYAGQASAILSFGLLITSVAAPILIRKVTKNEEAMPEDDRR